MITVSQIDTATKRIEQEFLKQCTYIHEHVGNVADYYACGQYLSRESTQRGIHGLAAAIRVLSESETESGKATLAGLIKYARDPLAAERENTPDDSEEKREILESLDWSLKNTIKVSELVIALSQVRRVVEGTEDVKRYYVSRLKAGIIPDQDGWGFFIENDNEKNVLPTAFAVLALTSVQEVESFSKPIRYLFEAVEEDHESDSSTHRSDISVRVFCIYVLSVLVKRFPEYHDKEKKVRKIFRRIWHQLETLMLDNIEQNIEYVGQRVRHHYIRVPWQLYLLSSAAYLSPLRSFGTVAAQNKFDKIINSINTNGGLCYEHSGMYLSTRTNAIVFDTLKNIRNSIKINQTVLMPLYYIDKSRLFLRSPFFIFVSRAIAMIIIAIALFYWFNDDVKIKDIGSSLVAGILVLLLSSNKGHK